MTTIPITLIIAIAAVFIGVLVVAAFVSHAVMERRTPERQRLRQLTAPAAERQLVRTEKDLVVNEDAEVMRVKTFVPKSPKDISRLRRRLMRAGYRTVPPVVIYFWAEITLPLVLGLGTLLFLGIQSGWLLAAFLAVVGYLTPGLVLARLIAARKQELQNGLPDALDLLIVCVEAGSSLDQGVLKTSEELYVSYPMLADELRTLNIEVRAGKPRIEAFRNLATRTGLDDVRALVAMLVQTDRFGTSIAEALRTLAQTLRTKRRQRAEERAAKIGVKLVFPLVFFLFPAFYVVTLGPAIIQFVRVFFGQVVGGP
jgi:tight adherence protein C